MEIKAKINRNCSKCNGTGKMLVQGSTSDALEIVDCDQCFYKPFVPSRDSTIDPPPHYYKITKVIDMDYEPCMFDNLPPGVYGISCPCRRCSVYC